MSYPYSGFTSDRYEFHFELPASPNGNPLSDASQTGDGAIDLALRSVPLPKGLMMRLGKLVYALPDNAATKVDSLGC